MFARHVSMHLKPNTPAEFKGRRPCGKFAPNSIRTSAFVDTESRNGTNFCIARRSGGISSIVSGRLRRSRLLARNNPRIARCVCTDTV